jgi:hypothetical protein
MPFYLEKKSTTSTPYVLADEAMGYLKLEGRSFHENIFEFFKDISEWLDGYITSDFGTFTFDCAMDYFNSSTVKVLYNILRKLDKYSVGDNKVTVNWITTEDNDIVIECGEDCQEDIINLEFNLIINEAD